MKTRFFGIGLSVTLGLSIAGVLLGAMVAVAQGQMTASSTSLAWVKANTDGFGDINNDDIWALEPFDSFLYAGTSNSDTGAEIWRSSQGSSWSAVITGGLGDANKGH